MKKAIFYLLILSHTQLYTQDFAGGVTMGLSASQVSGDTYRHDADQMRGWMHDPFRTFLTGVLRIECRFQEQKDIKISSFENPWSEFSGFGAKLPPPSLQLLRKENFDPILKYKAS